MHKKEMICASPVGTVHGEALGLELFEDVKTCLDSLTSRFGKLNESSKVRAQAVLERGAKWHGELFTMVNEAGSKAAWCLLPITATVK